MFPKSVIILILLFILLPATYFAVKHLKTQSQSQQTQSQSQPRAPVICGNLTCKQGEDCIQLSNLNSDTYTKLMNTKGTEITSNNNTTKSLTFCYSPPTTTESIKNALPASFDPGQPNYPYYNFDIPTGEKVALCIPNSTSSTDTTCFDKTKTDCTGSCQWTILPDSYDTNGGLVDTQVKNYMNYKMTTIQGTQGTQGYYCEPSSGVSLGKVTQTNDTNWKDCISQLANQGTIDANWDDTNKVCNLFQIPPYKNNSNQPIQKIQCSGNGSPCSMCSSNTDFVNAIRCTGTGTPCANCKVAGDYICDTCQPPTNPNGWNFATCAPNDSSGNVTQVIGYGTTSTNGNCPWGCSSANGGGNCYNVAIPSGSNNAFGQPLSTTNDIVCMQDSQVRSEPKNPIIKYKFDSTQGKCVQTTDQSYPSSICDCIKKSFSTVNSQTVGVGVVAYIMDNNNKKNYIYGSGEPLFKFTTDINNKALVGGNITLNSDGSITVQGDTLVLRTDATELYNNWTKNSNVFSSFSKFQYATPTITTDPQFINVNVVISEIIAGDVINFNYGYQFTTYGTLDLTHSWISDGQILPTGTKVDGRWTNEGITSPDNNNIYFSTIKFESEILFNNC